MSTKTHNKPKSDEKEKTQKARAGRKRQQQDQTFQPHPTEALQRVTNAPPSAVRPADILALQSSVGNRAVQRLVERARPRSGAPGVIQRRFDPPHLGGLVREDVAQFAQDRRRVYAEVSVRATEADGMYDERRHWAEGDMDHSEYTQGQGTPPLGGGWQIGPGPSEE